MRLLGSLAAHPESVFEKFRINCEVRSHVCLLTHKATQHSGRSWFGEAGGDTVGFGAAFDPRTPVIMAAPALNASHPYSDALDCQEPRGQMRSIAVSATRAGRYTAIVASADTAKIAPYGKIVNR